METRVLKNYILKKKVNNHEKQREFVNELIINIKHTQFKYFA